MAPLAVVGSSRSPSLRVPPACSGRGSPSAAPSPCVRRVALGVGLPPPCHPRRVRSVAPGGFRVRAMAAAVGDELVVLQYEDVCSARADLSSEIRAAYGPDGLGVLAVAGVPDVLAMRARLLPLAEHFAQAPTDVRRAAEDPGSHYSFGWSHGVETLEDGRPDSRKGSYYANPQFDKTTDDPDLMARYPSYCRPNVWPSAYLPELRPAFRDLGSTIIHVGTELARHCDLYVASHAPEGEAGERTLLAEVIGGSPCNKGRLLYYFPEETGAVEGAGGAGENWCGWHKDHGSLTGLTSACYLRDGEVVPCPDAQAGLHVRNRHGEVVRIMIPPDHLAFQIGEASQVHTGGLLRATPHFVRSAQGPEATGVSRSTLAVFMQPRWDNPMTPPQWAQGDVGVGQWREGDDFGEFTNRTLSVTTPG